MEDPSLTLRMTCFDRLSNRRALRMTCFDRLNNRRALRMTLSF